jgi:hypothetical protein
MPGKYSAIVIKKRHKNGNGDGGGSEQYQPCPLRDHSNPVKTEISKADTDQKLPHPSDDGEIGDAHQPLGIFPIRQQHHQLENKYQRKPKRPRFAVKAKIKGATR